MRRVALVVVPLGLALVAAGCGSSKKTASTSTGSTSSQSPPTDPASVRSAVAKTSKTSLHLDYSGTLTTSGQHVDLDGDGDLDARSRRGTMHVTIALGGQKIPLEEELDGQDVYVSSSFFSTFLPKGKKWLKVTLASASKTFGPSAFALTSPETVPPLSGVHRVGTATIDGVQTTEFSGTVDTAKLPAAEQRALQAGNVDFQPVDVWVGGDGYVHRTRIVTASSTGGTQATVQVTTTLSDFGEQVNATVPPAADVVSSSKIKIPGF